MRNRSSVGASRLWRQVNSIDVTTEAARNLSTFRSNRVNFRIAPWDPTTNGLRYLKYLLFNACRALTPRQRLLLDRVKNRNLGAPFTVVSGGRRICLDYLQASLECDFILSNMSLRGANVLEIGAGYGRTAHSLLSNAPLRSYTILDLDNCLHLAQSYLRRVLPPHLYAKLRFVPTSGFASLSEARFDLAINIDSFAEMEPPSVNAYLEYIAGHCRAFYAKNPVGKFIDPTCDAKRKRILASVARKMGPLRRVIDIYDERAVLDEVPRFHNAYRPKGFSLVADAWAGPWSYYWQALYRPARGR